jgi:hypothetical protein
MKKIVEINESDLVNVVKKVINEEELKRVRKGYSITPWDFNRFKAMGVTPYYYDSSVDGDCKMVEVTKRNLENNRKKHIFILKPEEFQKINGYIDSLNKVIKLELERIQLLKDMVPSILIEKIMV